MDIIRAMCLFDARFRGVTSVLSFYCPWSWNSLLLTHSTTPAKPHACVKAYSYYLELSTYRVSECKNQICGVNVVQVYYTSVQVKLSALNIHFRVGPRPVRNF